MTGTAETPSIYREWRHRRLDPDLIRDRLGLADASPQALDQSVQSFEDCGRLERLLADQGRLPHQAEFLGKIWRQRGYAGWAREIPAEGRDFVFFVP